MYYADEICMIYYYKINKSLQNITNMINLKILFKSNKTDADACLIFKPHYIG